MLRIVDYSSHYMHVQLNIQLSQGRVATDLRRCCSIYTTSVHICQKIIKVEPFCGPQCIYHALQY